jgi:hypothetical protein
MFSAAAAIRRQHSAASRRVALASSLRAAAAQRPQYSAFARHSPALFCLTLPTWSLSLPMPLERLSRQIFPKADRHRGRALRIGHSRARLMHNPTYRHPRSPHRIAAAALVSCPAIPAAACTAAGVLRRSASRSHGMAANPNGQLDHVTANGWPCQSTRRWPHPKR